MLITTPEPPSGRVAVAGPWPGWPATKKGYCAVLSIPAVMVSKGVIVDLNHVPWLPGSHTKKQEDFHRIFVKNVLWDGTKTDPAKQ